MQKIIITTALELEEMIFTSLRKAFGEFQLGKPKDPKGFLNLTEVSKFLNLAPHTIYGMTCKREIPFIKKGKKLYFTESDLITWLEKGRKFSQDELSEQSKGLTFKTKGGQND